MITLRSLNETSNDEFTAMLGGIFEHSSWIAAKAAISKPFTSLEELHAAMVAIVKHATNEEKLLLIQKHPNLGERVAMSKDSNVEQQGAGLKELTVEEYNRFLALNERYMKKFGFPFILAVKGKDKQDIYKAMETRVNHSQLVEFETALSEIYKIAFFRLQEKIIY